MFFLASTEFLLVDSIAESIYPRYSVGRDFMTDLGAVGSSTYLLWNSSLVVFGILWVCGTLLYFRGTKKRVPAICYVLIGFGTITVALSPENVNALILSFGATTAFLFGGISAVLSYGWTRPPFRFLSLSLGIIALAFLAIMIRGLDLGLGPGGIERAILYPELVWAISLGGYLSAGTRGSE